MTREEKDDIEAPTLAPSTPPASINAEDDDDDDERAPEVLVREENRKARWARVLVVVVLVSAAVVTSSLVFYFTRGLEKTAYKDSFDAVSTRIVDSLVVDTNLKFAMADTLAASVNLAMKTTGSTALNLTIDQLSWGQLTFEALFKGQIIFASWNPLLRTDEERREFEAYSQTQEFRNGAYQACLVCDTVDYMFKNEGFVPFPGFQPVDCATVDIATRTGGVEDERCEIVKAFANEHCQCVKVPDGVTLPTPIMDKPGTLFRIEEGEEVEEPYASDTNSSTLYHPFWNTAILNAIQPPVMFNQFSDPVRSHAISLMDKHNVHQMSKMFVREGLFYEKYAGSVGDVSMVLFRPVLNEEGTKVLGSVSLDILLSTYSIGVLPSDADMVNLVVENSCGQNFTFSVDPVTNKLLLVGEGDLHEQSVGSLSHSSLYDKFIFLYTADQFSEDFCIYRWHVFPTTAYPKAYLTNRPAVYAVVAFVIFVFTAMVLGLYDILVRRLQRKTLLSAKTTNDIVSSLFPKNVRNRLLDKAAAAVAASSTNANGNNFGSNKNKMIAFLSDEADKFNMPDDEPIADLFAHTTVMFLDIANFTQWSSEREANQVFHLLGSIYIEFDRIAASMGVFKVETIGDSYVAVCGLPQPCEDHAAVMARFAKRCLHSMTQVTKELEVQLGPSTGGLRARVGLHSGPVTAGVLAGDKSRFQLFGDTVNTASRMESYGVPGRIQASTATADLLVATGYVDWVHRNEHIIQVKGKGPMQTFWIYPREGGSVTNSDETLHKRDPLAITADDKITEMAFARSHAMISRLVAFNTEQLYSHLLEVVTARDSNLPLAQTIADDIALAERQIMDNFSGTIVIEEMKQVIPMPSFNAKDQPKEQRTIISPVVKEQLHDFVMNIGMSYRDVPFHNFDHASHVIMSVSKLMHRIVRPDGVDYTRDQMEVKSEIHTSTYGISSHPLLRFAVVFSALIHDVDHTGLTNTELMKSVPSLAEAYKNKSVAEQNSVDVAWTMLMDAKYKELRACIYSTKEELYQFRQLVVNAVMATDIADKNLKSLREQRWDVAFSSSSSCASTMASKDNMDRRATVVYEYIIQASDIAHTMQHWQTYQKFNRRLFEERYEAWLNGHLEADPTRGWYKGELGFFDFYIIPLAKKLNHCGVFGVTYDEFLSYALSNRQEWEMKGKDVVEEMGNACREKYAEQLLAKELPPDMHALH